MQENITHSWWSYKNIRKSIFVLLLLLVISSNLFVSFIYVIENNFFYIEDIKLEGLRVTDQASVESFLENKKNTKILNIIKNNSLLTFTFGGIKEELLNNFKSLEGLELKMVSKHALALRALEWQAVAFWCDAQNNCYYVNKNGDIFGKMVREEGSIEFLVKIISSVGEGEPVGQKVVESEYLKEILDLEQELKSKGYIVENIDYIDKIQKDFELFIRGIGFVTFRLDDKFKDTVNNFYSIIYNPDIEEGYSSYNTSTTTLAIDFRYGNNVIYYKKLKDNK